MRSPATSLPNDDGRAGASAALLARFQLAGDFRPDVDPSPMVMAMGSSSSPLSDPESTSTDAPETAGSHDSVIDQLTKLGTLRESAVLTEDEFPSAEGQAARMK